MKKSIVFLAILAFAVTFVACGSKTEKQYKSIFPQNGWDDYELKGKVKELHITEYEPCIPDAEIEEENIEDRIKSSYVVYFYEDGQIEKAIFNNGWNTYYYIYSGDTCILERHQNSGEDSYETSDEPNKITKLMEIVKDKRGNWISYALFDLANKETSRDEYTYNEQGLLTEMQQFYQGKMISKHIFSDHNKSGFYQKQMSYDVNGDLHAITFWDGDDIKHIKSNVRLDKDGNVESKLFYEYNQYGHLTKMTVQGKTENIKETFEYTYKYDPFGNYIEKTQTNTGSIYVTTVERTIVYY